MKTIANFNNKKKATEISKGSNSIRRRHNSYYSPALKLEAINFAKQTSYEMASKRFQVHTKSVRNWHKSEDEIKML
jgi:transposase-like protein